MMKLGRNVVVALGLGAVFIGAYGCKKEGPAERAGKEVDKTAEKAGKQIEKAGDKVKDAIEDMKK